MDFAPFLPFLLATFVGSVTAVVGYAAARRAGLGPVQGQYVQALEGNNRMLNERLDLLEDELKREKAVRARLAKKVLRLERTVVTLAEENDYLRRKAGLPRRATAVEVADDPGNDEDLTDEGV